MAFLEVAVRQDTAQPGVGPREPHARCGPAYPQEPGDLGGWPFFFELVSEREHLAMLVAERGERSRELRVVRILARWRPRGPLITHEQVSRYRRGEVLLRGADARNPGSIADGSLLVPDRAHDARYEVPPAPGSPPSAARTAATLPVRLPPGHRSCRRLSFWPARSSGPARAGTSHHSRKQRASGREAFGFSRSTTCDVTLQARQCPGTSGRRAPRTLHQA